MACCYMTNMNADSGGLANYMLMAHCTQGTVYADLYDEGMVSVASCSPIYGGNFPYIQIGTELLFFGY